MKVLFVSDYKHKVKDGLSYVVETLGFDKYNVGDDIPDFSLYDFILGHGAFHSKVDYLLRMLPNKKGLCIAGNVHKQDTDCYDILFYETDWVKDVLNLKGNIKKAFGVNQDIFFNKNYERVFDYISVGALAFWKRHELIANKSGLRAVIGEIQKENPQESMSIIDTLLKNNVCVIPHVESELLSTFYNLSKNVYIPAHVVGGGERAVLEARSCGCNVVVEDDNPKLQELLNGDIPSHVDYLNIVKQELQKYGNL